MSTHCLPDIYLTRGVEFRILILQYILFFRPFIRSAATGFDATLNLPNYEKQ